MQTMYKCVNNVRMSIKMQENGQTEAIDPQKE